MMTAKILMFGDSKEKATPEVLTPESPRWEQFIAKLDSIGLIGGP
jgi:hypothetical protein